MSWIRLIKAPYFFVRQRLDSLKGRIRYGNPEDYNAQRYWEDRHSQYGFDLRGVGNRGLTTAENEAQYREAAEVFQTLCDRDGISLANKTALDIGCGVGFYAGILAEGKVKSYLGIDITDRLFNDLMAHFPGFRFVQNDITAKGLSETFDLVIMIDVSQHITNDAKFATAMKHVNEAVQPGGTLILTSWLSKEESHSYYEKSRTMADYQAFYPNWTISAPIPFRDKFIFSLKKPGTVLE